MIPENTEKRIRPRDLFPSQTAHVMPSKNLYPSPTQELFFGNVAQRRGRRGRRHEPSSGRILSIPSRQSELGRVFAAATVSDEFRKKLLEDPEKALDEGYLGQGFNLTPDQYKAIKSANAENITELAQKVSEALKKTKK